MESRYRDAREVMDLVEGLRSRFTERDNLYAAIDEMLYAENEIRIPEAYDYYALRTHTRLGFFAAETITATLCANPLIIQFAPVRPGIPGDENATLREHWHEAAWERQEHDAHRSLYYPWMWALVTKGMAVYKTLRRSQRYWKDYYSYANKRRLALEEDPSVTPRHRRGLLARETEQYKRTLPFPLVTTDVPPEMFWFNRNQDGLTLCAEASEVPYNRLYADFKKLEDIAPSALGIELPRDQGWSGCDDMLTLHQLWTPTTVTYVVEGLGGDRPRYEIVEEIEHGLGDLRTGTLCGPYSIAQGIVTGSRRPELESVGALHAFMELLPQLDATLTARGQLAFITSYPTLERVPKPGPLGGMNQEEMFGSGPVAEEGDDEPIFEPGRVMPIGVRFAQPPHSSGEMEAFTRLLMQFLEPLLPPSAYGGGPAESGYAVNQRVHMNLLVWDPFVKNAQSALANRFGIEDRLIEQIGETVYVDHWTHEVGQQKPRVTWQGLGPPDVDGIYQYHVLLQPTTPSSDALLVRQILEEMQGGLETQAGGLERLGRNFDEFWQQHWIEKILSSPQVEEQTMRDILQRLGLGDEAAVAKANQDLAELAASGYFAQSPQGGAPSAPAPAAPILPPGGVPGMGPGQGQVYAPGQGMPFVPTPAGGAGGMPSGGGAMGPFVPPGTPPGARMPPPNAYALPGQGSMR